MPDVYCRYCPQKTVAGFTKMVHGNDIRDVDIHGYHFTRITRIVDTRVL